MSQRTTIAAVTGILGVNWDGSTPLQPFIDGASNLVDTVVTYAATKRFPAIVLPASTQELIERWLAAHFYCQMDPLYMSKGNSGASGSFQRAGAVEGFETTDYGKTACRLDYSGCLVAIGKRQVAAGFGSNYPQGPYGVPSGGICGS